ncbi:hypothetical protein BU24DRAFT_469067 [Aaosphaeria arxii CBS 175.79]|uniref:Uncharacterized protein n=1 Tax=Aaosphaeria arxii CBS 175.79 TaxID=1450172 RepID=A0A6A5X694_9PLEO|nr:uncharacterized protein BU24DRAFT_469067 [Aaosphaeria arxii CBS 175.79]KAF2008304.1 hypothetical protein BU24DRAFT_469067 [Aaosphaeria arxii CBS 175.79]
MSSQWAPALPPATPKGAASRAASPSEPPYPRRERSQTLPPAANFAFPAAGMSGQAGPPSSPTKLPARLSAMRLVNGLMDSSITRLGPPVPDVVPIDGLKYDTAATLALQSDFSRLLEQRAQEHPTIKSYDPMTQRKTATLLFGFYSTRGVASLKRSLQIAPDALNLDTTIRDRLEAASLRETHPHFSELFRYARQVWEDSEDQPVRTATQRALTAIRFCSIVDDIERKYHARDKDVMKLLDPFRKGSKRIKVTTLIRQYICSVSNIMSANRLGDQFQYAHAHYELVRQLGWTPIFTLQDKDNRSVFRKVCGDMVSSFSIPGEVLMYHMSKKEFLPTNISIPAGSTLQDISHLFRQIFGHEPTLLDDTLARQWVQVLEVNAELDFGSEEDYGT